MNIILFGPQGSGKGTQARLLCEKFGFFYFESGAYLRRIAESHPELKESLSEGKLVPDTEMTSYLAAFFDQQNLYDDILFDGFPRTLEQYNFFKNWLKDKSVTLDLGIVLEISEEETLKRLSSRRLNPETGEIYSLAHPLPTGVDIEKLIQRDDDKPESIKRRLNLYRTRTEELINEIKKDMKVVEVNGERSESEIFNDLVLEIEKIKKWIK